MAASRRYCHVVIAAALSLLLSSCGDEAFTPDAASRAPLLTLVQTGTETVALRIAGPVGLRAFQSRLSYDPAKLTLTKIAGGEESDRLDRIFFSDLKTSAGDVVVGLTDTRQVQLPARGALLSLTVARAGAAAGSATLKVTGALGADEGGERIPMQDTSAEVKLP
jgi:hypothetical protein